MYVVVQHRFTNPPVAFSRGEKLIKNEGAPAGAQGLQFYRLATVRVRPVSGRHRRRS